MTIYYKLMICDVEGPPNSKLFSYWEGVLAGSLIAEFIVLMIVMAIITAVMTTYMKRRYGLIFNMSMSKDPQTPRHSSKATFVTKCENKPSGNR